MTLIIVAVAALVWLLVGLAVVVLCVAAQRADGQAALDGQRAIRVLDAPATADSQRRSRTHAPERRSAPAGSAAAA